MLKHTFETESGQKRHVGRLWLDYTTQNLLLLVKHVGCRKYTENGESGSV